MEGMEGKQIIIFYDDSQAVSRKEGLCTFDSNTEIELDNSIIIQKRRIIRIEVVRWKLTMPHTLKLV